MTGALVTIDGPGGSGKTATVAALADELRRRGRTVHVTAEPSAGPIGRLARALVDEASGYALACLVAADRYHHLDTEIRPQARRGPHRGLATVTLPPPWSSRPATGSPPAGCLPSTRPSTCPTSP